MWRKNHRKKIWRRNPAQKKRTFHIGRGGWGQEVELRGWSRGNCGWGREVAVGGVGVRGSGGLGSVGWSWGVESGVESRVWGRGVVVGLKVP